MMVVGGTPTKKKFVLPLRGGINVFKLIIVIITFYWHLFCRIFKSICTFLFSSYLCTLYVLTRDAD